MSITEQQINDAYKRTREHPADQRVRLTSDQNDVVALHYPGVKAVIYERSMPEKITALLKSGLAQKQYMRPQTRVDENNQIENLDWAQKTPMALQEDSLFLLQIFQNAAQQDIVKNEILPRIYKQSLSGEFNYKAFAGDRTTTMRPHVDGVAVKIRALTSYTLDEELNTLWFPGDLTENDIEQLHLDLLNNYEQACKKYNMQIIPLGHILLMKAKGYTSPLDPASTHISDPIDRNELLVHSKPMPKKNQARYTNIYP